MDITVTEVRENDALPFPIKFLGESSKRMCTGFKSKPCKGVGCNDSHPTDLTNNTLWRFPVSYSRPSHEEKRKTVLLIFGECLWKKCAKGKFFSKDQDSLFAMAKVFEAEKIARVLENTVVVEAPKKITEAAEDGKQARKKLYQAFEDNKKEATVEAVVRVTEAVERVTEAAKKMVEALDSEREAREKSDHHWEKYRRDYSQYYLVQNGPKVTIGFVWKRKVKNTSHGFEVSNDGISLWRLHSEDEKKFTIQCASFSYDTPVSLKHFSSNNPTNNPKVTTLNIAWLKMDPWLTPNEKLFVHFIARNICRKIDGTYAKDYWKRNPALLVIYFLFNKYKHARMHKNGHRSVFYHLVVVVSVFVQVCLKRGNATEKMKKENPLHHRMVKINNGKTNGNLPNFFDQFIFVPLHFFHKDGTEKIATKFLNWCVVHFYFQETITTKGGNRPENVYEKTIEWITEGCKGNNFFP
eukprot:m.19639 g.19639  ORF g.19639 m.19639 type:complete len:467 (+) comp8491_c0_seq1:617-2017(+)